MANNILFDLEVVRACSRNPEELARTLLDKHGKGDIGKSLGFIGVELPLRAAQEIAGLLRNAGGASLVLPCRYRQPTISMDAARTIADRRLEDLKLEQGNVFGPLEDGQEQWMWWRFYADHLPSIEEGREPGCIYIDIDKLDGHVKNEDDSEEYRRWQAGK
jgi:hypothetical protein